VTHEDVLDLHRVDILAAADDHVLHPVLQVDVAIRVGIGEVAREAGRMGSSAT
jgi:hypothetical protein